MANFAIATQILIDGPRNVVSKTTGDVAVGALPTNVTILDPATVTSMMPGMPGSFGPTLFDIREIEYSVTDGIILQLTWDATTPIAIAELYGRGTICLQDVGGIHNNAGAGVTGKIMLSAIASGAASPTQVSFFFTLRCVKFRPQAFGGA